MREFVRDRGSSPVIVSAPGRRRQSDGKGCRKTWLNKGRNPVHEMESILGVDPGREWAQVRADGERAAVGGGGAPGRGAMPAGWAPPSGAHAARGTGKRGRRRRGAGAGGGSASVHGAETAAKSPPDAPPAPLLPSPRPATAPAVPVAAPSGPGPPATKGPRSPIAAA